MSDRFKLGLMVAGTVLLVGTEILMTRENLKIIKKYKTDCKDMEAEIASKKEDLKRQA